MKYSKTRKVFRKTKRKTVLKKRTRTYKGGSGTDVHFSFTVKLTRKDRQPINPIVLNNKGEILVNRNGKSLMPELNEKIKIPNIMRHINTFRPTEPGSDIIMKWYTDYHNETNRIVEYGENFKINNYSKDEDNIIHYNASYTPYLPSKNTNREVTRNIMTTGAIHAININHPLVYKGISYNVDGFIDKINFPEGYN